jgi:branched-chain amino acid aminotransferase
MRRSARELGITWPDHDIQSALGALLSAATGHHILRLTLARGTGARGLAVDIAVPTLIATLQPFDASLRFQPVMLKTTSITRNLHSPLSRLKTLSYLENILAAREATAAGFDDALMLNTAGYVACTSIGNVFLEIAGELVTPDLQDGILPGITRSLVITLARSAGIKVREVQIQPSDIATASAMFVTNSLRFIRPVTRCDDRLFSAPSKQVDSLMAALLNAEQDQLKMR